MTLSLGDLLRTPTIFDLQPKPKAQIESEVDLLVIACARARLLDEGDHSIGFRQQELLKKMIPADLDQASLIREYYGKKLMLIQLKDKVELSSFRKALANFLTSDGKTYTEETIGLVYKLPRFYHYDKTVDLLREDHGVEGDAHAGPWTRQVSFLASESIRETRERGLEVSFGDFAENIATEGLDWTKTLPGTQVQLGESAIVEITQIGKECKKKCAIYYQAGDCIMPREGVFARVLRGGTIRLGDPIRLLNA